MDVDEFRSAVCSSQPLLKSCGLWIEVEFYKGCIRDACTLSEESLEELAGAASRNAELRACAHRLFSVIVDMITLDADMPLKRVNGSCSDICIRNMA